jgi:fumarate hydratase class I
MSGSNQLEASLLELIRKTSTHLPPDVSEVLLTRQAFEEAGSKADLALALVARNIALAQELSAPICQDTGSIAFFVSAPVGYDQHAFTLAAEKAVAEATAKGYLRQNSVDSVTGANTGNNLGPGSPSLHFHQHASDEVDVRLILKGGGCENMSAQFSLPCTVGGKRLDRDLEGVRGAILEAVWEAQGKGCGPGFLGVCIGGDRAQGYAHAKEQLLRLVDDTNPDPVLAELENNILADANKLEIGPMGFGGKLTVGACKVGKLNRLPASFFVTIAYMCWAYRRRGLILDQHGGVKRWLYEGEGKPVQSDQRLLSEDEVKGRMKSAIRLKTPLTEQSVRGLKAGDTVLLSGKIFTGRDEVHKYLFKGGDLPMLREGVIYHCGPVVLGGEGSYRVVAAGPTTSIREEPYQATVIERYSIRAVIGKGGMGPKTLEACKAHGCVYLHAIGGASQIYAQSIKRVDGVHLKEKFGSPEAVWELEVVDFPAVVTMDSHGNSLHQTVQDKSLGLLKEELAAGLRH